MRTDEYSFLLDREFYVGHLNRYPHYQTQGYSREELVENLIDLLTGVTSDSVPYVSNAG